jgi:hypothetical protein
MKQILIPVFLLAITGFASGAMTEKTTTEKIKTFCDTWVEVQNNPPKITALTTEEVRRVAHQLEFSQRCQSFIVGVSNEMIGELTWLDDTHRKVVVGNWDDGVTPKQEILVFVEFVNQNPALLNKPATSVFRQSVEAAGLYLYTSAP